MIFVEILQLNCYAVPELPPSRNYPRPGIPYITVQRVYGACDPGFKCIVSQGILNYLMFFYLKYFFSSRNHSFAILNMKNRMVIFHKTRI